MLIITVGEQHLFLYDDVHPLFYHGGGNVLEQLERVPHVFIDLWVDDARSMNNELAQAYTRDRGLKGHGVIVYVQAAGIDAAVYARSDSCRVNPDSLATGMIATATDRIERVLREQGASDDSIRYEVSAARVQVQYWLHPATSHFHSLNSCALASTRERLSDFADAALENLERVDRRDVVGSMVR